MIFIVQKYDAYSCIRVEKRMLDHLVAPGLKAELVVLVENGEKNILVDLTACADCDASGMSALLFGNRLCREANGKFIVCGCNEQILEMAEIADFQNHLRLVETKEEAKEFFFN